MLSASKRVSTLPFSGGAAMAGAQFECRIDGIRRDIETHSLRLTVRMGVVTAALAASIEI